MTACSHSSIRNLLAAWRRQRVPLASWVRSFVRAYDESGLNELDAAEAMGCTVAELEAVIRLSLLDDETLELVSEANPPMTTWLLLSEMSSEDIPKVLETASAIGDAKSDYERMERAFRAVSAAAGSPAVGTVQVLEPRLFDFALRKATAYSIWEPDNKKYKNLGKFAERRRSGKPLSQKQTADAIGLLQEIIEAGAVRIPSPDGDEDDCALLIEAAG